MTTDRVRVYLVTELTEPLRRSQTSTRPEDALSETYRYLRQNLNEVKCEVTALPMRAGLCSSQCPKQLDKAVVVITTTEDELERIKPSGIVRDVGIDAPIFPTRHWCRGRDGRAFFGDRDAAERLISATWVKDHVVDNPAEVRVAIFDTGIDESVAVDDVWSAASMLEGADLENAPPAARDKIVGGGHGTQTARQVLSLAPNAIINDYRILAGDRIRSPPAFVSGAIAGYQHLAARMKEKPRPWIAVNAWSLFDKALDPGRGGTDECLPGSRPTALYDAIEQVEKAGADVVFAAGNCGGFCADPRCAQGSAGPDSILGVASLPSVLCVGAVRCDGIWDGSSSEGGDGDGMIPGALKPDLCAPSGFSEDGNAGILNTGTSTACALTAGAIAALRREFPAPSPQTMREVLRQTARPDPSVPRRRIGAGVLDVARAHARLAKQGPGA